mmetsp:Transcript_37699/g.108414  ORF Transcript_37699/g.108414 Transcript_37699/m.108414 type:complete len:217 (-) Transcript_37699:17-667(-)
MRPSWRTDSTRNSQRPRSLIACVVKLGERSKNWPVSRDPSRRASQSATVQSKASAGFLTAQATACSPNTSAAWHRKSSAGRRSPTSTSAWTEPLGQDSATRAQASGDKRPKRNAGPPVKQRTSKAAARSWNSSGLSWSSIRRSCSSNWRRCSSSWRRRCGFKPAPSPSLVFNPATACLTAARRAGAATTKANNRMPKVIRERRTGSTSIAPGSNGH